MHQNHWPPISCEPTPCDFFLWGHVKEKFYAQNLALIKDLNDGILVVIEEIRLPPCNLVMENFIERIWSSRRGHGGHWSDVIFH